MNQRMPIFPNAEATIDELIAAWGHEGWCAHAEEVGSVQAAHAIEGEMWAPQLTPYEEWKSSGSMGVEGSHDGDLFKVGFLHMGASNELRERMVAIGLEAARRQAEAQRKAEEEAAAYVVGPENVDYARVFGVKDGADGFVLSKVDLREYAKQSGVDEGLVVVLPSEVAGIPVTRIGADAFSRFNVRGIGVRLLVVPDGIRSIDAKAFSNLAAEAVFIGAGCHALGAQALERWALKPAIEKRTYVISPDNSKWRSHAGSILSKDGSHLLFFAPPYNRRVAIPAGVRRVGADAIAKWGAIPEVVECALELERVDSRQWDNSLWLCPQEAPIFDALQRRDVRLASPSVVEKDECWYDFDDRGALLVAGPPAPLSPSQTFARAAAASAKTHAPQGAAALAKQVAHAGPSASALDVAREVAGRPLVRVAPRALVTAPETLVLPEGLLEVGHDNACKGTRRVSLPQSLRRIGAHSFCSRELEGITSIPASVMSIGEGCFEYSVVRLEHVGAVVHVSANQLLNCFIERSDEEIASLSDDDALARVPFDFARYDKLLCEGANLPQRIGALVHRLVAPVELSKTARDNLVAQLRREAQSAMEFIAREGDAAHIARLVDVGFIDDDTFDTQIELLRRANRTDCVMLLMERRHGSTRDATPVKSRFTL